MGREFAIVGDYISHLDDLSVFGPRNMGVAAGPAGIDELFD